MKRKCDNHRSRLRVSPVTTHKHKAEVTLMGNVIDQSEYIINR